MSIGSWVETNVVLPLGNLLLKPENLQKIAAVFEPMLDRMVSAAITQVGLQVSASEMKVVNTIGEAAKASEQTVISGVSSEISSIEKTVTDMPNTVITAIKSLNPFHL